MSFERVCYYYIFIYFIFFLHFFYSIRVGEFFKDFDPLRSYKCSPAQFSRVLSTEKFTLPEEEVNALVEHYLTEDGKMVKYKEFLDEVENVFVDKTLTKSPTTRTITRDFSNTHSVVLSPSEQAIYDRVISDLQTQVANRRMSVMEFFQDHDRLKNHHITAAQFIRCMPFSVSEDEINVILKKYTDGQPQDGVNYYQFVFDISNPPEEEDRMAMFTQTASLVPLEKPRERPPEAVAVVTKVQAMVLKGRIRLMEFFRDFDKLRSYVCLPEHFRSALSSAKV